MPTVALLIGPSPADVLASVRFSLGLSILDDPLPLSLLDSDVHSPASLPPE